MLTILAAVIALLCIAACVRRLAFAIAPTALDPTVLVEVLRGDAGRARFPAVAQAVRALPEGAWERALFESVARPPQERAALVNEQLTELDYALSRWERVPRVCASIASSSGFLLASLALRNALSEPEAFAEATRQAALGSGITSALNVATIGIAGATFCVAAQFRAKKAARARLEATDKLVERIEALAQ